MITLILEGENYKSPQTTYEKHFTQKNSALAI